MSSVFASSHSKRPKMVVNVHSACIHPSIYEFRSDIFDRLFYGRIV